jgi:hypothetical protein
MKVVGDVTAARMRRAAERGGWRAAGFDLGRGNRMPKLMDMGLMAYDPAARDYVVTEEGRRFLAGFTRRRHRKDA